MKVYWAVKTSFYEKQRVTILDALNLIKSTYQFKETNRFHIFSLLPKTKYLKNQYHGQR